MLAVKKGHSEVVKAMMKEKPELVSSQLGSGSTVIHWALEECLCSAFFKVFYHLVVSIILGTHIENISACRSVYIDTRARLGSM